MYAVIYSKDAQRVLMKLPSALRARIKGKMERIAADPYGKHNNALKLAGDEELYRLRVGDWRVFYTIENERLLVLVTEVESRGSAYRH